MPEPDRFEARFRRAYRRYLDEAPTEVDAAAVARAAATQPRFGGFRWPTIGAPARVLVWVVLLALLLAALSAGALFTGSQPPTPVSATEVTGVGPCDVADPGEWSGSWVGGGATERLSGQIRHCTMDVSDERMVGDIEVIIDCTYAMEDGVLVGQCWGTSVLRNEGGAWAGVVSGTTGNEAGAQDIMEEVLLGTGEYAGLRFVATVATAVDPNVITGRIEPTD